MKKIVAFTLKVSVTISLIWLVLRNQNLETGGEQLYEISVFNVLIAFLLLAGQNVIAALRWVVVVRTLEQVLLYPLALRFYFEGLFFNQALPSTIGGDGVRMYRAIKAGLPVTSGINGVLLDLSLIHI